MESAASRYRSSQNSPRMTMDQLSKVAEAMERGLEFFKQIAGNGFDVNRTISDGDGTQVSLLHIAAGHWDEVERRRIVEYLIKQGANVNARAIYQDEEDGRVEGRTPVQIATIFGNADTLELLLQSDADPHLRDSKGKNCHDLAIEYFDTGECYRVLKSYMKSPSGPMNGRYSEKPRTSLSPDSEALEKVDLLTDMLNRTAFLRDEDASPNSSGSSSSTESRYKIREDNEKEVYEVYDEDMKITLLEERYYGNPNGKQFLTPRSGPYEDGPYNKAHKRATKVHVIHTPPHASHVRFQESIEISCDSMSCSSLCSQVSTVCNSTATQPSCHDKDATLNKSFIDTTLTENQSESDDQIPSPWVSERENTSHFTGPRKSDPSLLPQLKDLPKLSDFGSGRINQKTEISDTNLQDNVYVANERRSSPHSESSNCNSSVLTFDSHGLRLESALSLAKGGLDSPLAAMVHLKPYPPSAQKTDNWSKGDGDRESICSIQSMSESFIQTQVQKLGAISPVPLTRSTKKVYERIIKDKLLNSASPKSPQNQGGGDSSCLSPNYTLSPSYRLPVYPRELNLFIDGTYKRDVAEGLLADLESHFEDLQSPRRYFNYLLLDPRKLGDNFCAQITDANKRECFGKFVKSIFYVGKGTAARPLHHLFEAYDSLKSMDDPDMTIGLDGGLTPKGPKRISKKLTTIKEIWDSQRGVVSHHCFQNLCEAEAFSRESLMIEAIDKKNLTNLQKGKLKVNPKMKMDLNNDHKRRLLGSYLLYKAYEILIVDGVREIKSYQVKPNKS